LALVEGFAFTFGRHSQVRVKSRDIANERAVRTVAGDDIDSVFAALESGSSAIEAEMAPRPFRAVTAKAGLIQDGLDVVIEIDLDGCGRRQVGLLDLSLD